MSNSDFPTAAIDAGGATAPSIFTSYDATLAAASGLPLADYLAKCSEERAKRAFIEALFAADESVELPIVCRDGTPYDGKITEAEEPLYVTPLTSGGVAFLFGVMPDATPDSYKSCIIAPTAALYRDGTMLLFWALDLFYPTTACQDVGMALGMEALNELVPLPEDGWELTFVDSSIFHSIDELRAAYVVPKGDAEVAGVTDGAEAAPGEDRYWGKAKILNDFDPNDPRLAEPIMVTYARGRKDTRLKPKAKTRRNLLSQLTCHDEGEKDGKAVVFADMPEGQRLKLNVKACTAVSYDLDFGDPVPEVLEVVKRSKKQAAIHTSFSHKKEISYFPRDVVVKFLGEDTPIDNEGVRRFLHGKMNERIVESAYFDNDPDDQGFEWVEGKGLCVRIHHKALPKLRVTFLLEKPFDMATVGKTVAESHAKYKAFYHGFAAEIGLKNYDKSCDDVGRLFNLPRYPKGGQPEAWVSGGDFVNYEDYGLDDPTENLERNFNSGTSKSKTPGGKALGAWWVHGGNVFQFATALGKPGKSTFHCAFENGHGNAGATDDTAFFAADGGDGGKFCAGECAHNTCKPYTVLDHIAKKVIDGELDVDRLFDPDLLTPATDDNGKPIADMAALEKIKAKVIGALKGPEAAAKEEAKERAQAEASYKDAIETLALNSTDAEINKVLIVVRDARLVGAALVGAIRDVAVKIGKDIPFVKASIRALPSKRGGYAAKAPAADLDVPEGITHDKHGAIESTFNNCHILLSEVHHKEWQFAYNELGVAYVMRATKFPWVDNIGGELTDDAIRRIRLFLQQLWGVDFGKDNVYEVTHTIARMFDFNPLIEYLDSLKWDGVHRIEKLFVTYCGAADNDYARAVGKIWPVAAVRRAKQPGCKFDTMPILDSPSLQGINKSTFFKILGGEWFSDVSLGDVDNKDAPINLRGVWIYEMPELSSMKRSDANAMKGFGSRQVDKYRAPHDKTAKSYPRRVVFCGTTNDSAFLTDQTGNRRYWPIKVSDEIDIESLTRDRDQIWAEAVHLEKSGMSIVLPKPLWQVAGVEQAERTIRDPWIDTLTEYLDALPDGEESSREYRGKISTRDLLQFALFIEPARQSINEMKHLRAAMQAIPDWEYKTAIDFTHANEFEAELAKKAESTKKQAGQTSEKSPKRKILAGYQRKAAKPS